LAKHNQISQINVLLQLEHLSTYPFIRNKIKKGELHLHGWWFDIAKVGFISLNPAKINLF